MSDELDVLKNPLPLQAHTQRKQQQWKKLAKLGDDPDWWTDQMEQISSGITLEELAVAAQVNFSIYRHWIMGSTQREKEYAAAVTEKKRRQRQRVEERLYKTALNPTGHPTHADANRAAEILLNSREGIGGGPVAPGAVNLTLSFVDAKDGKPAEKVISGEVVQ